MRITTKGQVTIPQAIRERAGLLPNTEVEFRMDGDLVFLVRAGRAKAPTRGRTCSRWVSCSTSSPAPSAPSCVRRRPKR